MTDLKAKANLYAKLVSELTERMGTMPEFDYERGRAAVERARCDAEMARRTLMDHKAEHRCQA